MASGWKHYDRSRPRDRSPSRDKRLPHSSLNHRSPSRRGPTRSISPIKNSRDSKYVEAKRSDRERRYDKEEYSGERDRDRNHERVSHRDWSRNSERNSDRGDQRRERNRDRRQDWERPVDRDRQREEDRIDGWAYSRDEEQFEEVGSQQPEYYDLDQEEHERDQRESRRLDYSERDNRRGNGRLKPINGTKSYQSTSRTEFTRQSKGNYHRPMNSNDQKPSSRQKYQHFRPSTYDNKRTHTGHRNGRSRSRSPPRRQPISRDLDAHDLEGARRKKRRLDSSR
ncbi:hypothetical protein DFH28DRAFT_417834 [Melampsora americana]|nr:hypothetical protein DFH28DRAFT_417834 [Melampsora americana]